MSAAASTEARHPESIRETIDSIVIALILAFVFRAFVVEAFIIPTGSMAPTLYGAHGTILCEDCGTEFAYGLKDLADEQKSPPVKPNSAAICPNCKHLNRNLRVNDVARNPEAGDRILVLKWPLDTQLDALGPRRWDVTVFKDPKDGDTNFIKRLAGLPNEVLMILDGDVYTVPTSQLSEPTLSEMERLAREKHTYLRPLRNRGPDYANDPKFARWWGMDGRPKPPSQQALDEIYDKLTIRQKTAVAQKSLWFTLYDHDYPPKVLDDYQPHWVAVLSEKSGWTVEDRHVHYHDAQLNQDHIYLAGESFEAMCAYNVASGERPEVVSDLRVRAVVTPGSPTGQIQVRLAKWGRAFMFIANMNGDVSVVEEPSPQSQNLVKLTGRTSPWVAGKPVEFSVEILDYRLAMSIAGQEVLTSSRDPKSASYYGANVKALMKRQAPATNSPQIHALGGDFDLSHLVVERDEHYYSRGSGNVPFGGWASAGNPILLRKGEYFMLGDNTAASYDSRLWEVVDEQFAKRGENFQIGTVPEDQLIGRAFFVYWPSGRKLDWLPSWLPLGRFGIIPDVGRMRWIR